MVQPRLSTDRQCALPALSRAPRIQTAQRAPRLPKAQRRYDPSIFLPLSPECCAIQSKRTKGKGRWHTCPAWVTSVLYTRAPKSSPSQWRDQARPCILLASPERIDEPPIDLDATALHWLGHSGQSGYAAGRSSLSAPRITILNASSGNGRCNAFAASTTGIAFVWTGFTTAFASVVRKR